MFCFKNCTERIHEITTENARLIENHAQCQYAYANQSGVITDLICKYKSEREELLAKIADLESKQTCQSNLCRPKRMYRRRVENIAQ